MDCNQHEGHKQQQEKIYRQVCIPNSSESKSDAPEDDSNSRSRAVRLSPQCPSWQMRLMDPSLKSRVNGLFRNANECIDQRPESSDYDDDKKSSCNNRKHKKSSNDGVAISPFSLFSGIPWQIAEIGKKPEKQDDIDKKKPARSDVANDLANPIASSTKSGRSEESDTISPDQFFLVPSVHYRELRQQQNTLSAEKCLVQGIDAARRGDNDRAQQQYEQGLELRPDHANLLVAFGALRANQGQYASAMEYMDKALEVEPDHYNAKTYRSLIVERINNPSFAGKTDQAQQTSRRSGLLDKSERALEDASLERAVLEGSRTFATNRIGQAPQTTAAAASAGAAAGNSDQYPILSDDQEAGEKQGRAAKKRSKKERRKRDKSRDQKEADKRRRKRKRRRRDSTSSSSSSDSDFDSLSSSSDSSTCSSTSIDSESTRGERARRRRKRPRERRRKQKREEDKDDDSRRRRRRSRPRKEERKRRRRHRQGNDDDANTDNNNKNESMPDKKDSVNPGTGPADDSSSSSGLPSDSTKDSLEVAMIRKARKTAASANAPSSTRNAPSRKRHRQRRKRRRDIDSPSDSAESETNVDVNNE